MDYSWIHRHSQPGFLTEEKRRIDSSHYPLPVIECVNLPTIYCIPVELEQSHNVVSWELLVGHHVITAVWQEIISGQLSD